MGNKFKDKITPNKGLQNVGKSEELPLLVSFAEFAHGDSPDNQKLHKKMNEALSVICNANWRQTLLKNRHDLGGFETIPQSSISGVSFPSAYKADAWVMCCGVRVGRLIGYIENIHSRTIFRPLKLDTFECYNH